MTWTEEQQDRMLPRDGDLARAMALTAGTATGDTDAIDYTFYESMQQDRMPQLVLALAELLVRAHQLREDTEALQQWRNQIASHRHRADNNNESEQ